VPLVPWWVRAGLRGRPTCLANDGAVRLACTAPLSVCFNMRADGNPLAALLGDPDTFQCSELLA
jgi:hypothetical protein